MIPKHRSSVRWFVTGAVVLVVVFGSFTLLKNIEANSPAVRAAQRLIQSGRFEPLGFDWKPEWSLQALEKSPWSGANKKGVDNINPHTSVMVINFWATWCEPCRAELPAMFQLAREMAKLGVWWVFVSYDESWEAPQALLQRVRGALSSNVVMLRDPAANAGSQQDSKTLMNKLGTAKLPETYFVKNGRVLAKIIGAINWTQPDIKDYLRSLGAK